MQLQNAIKEFKTMLQVNNAYGYASMVLSIDGSTAAPVASVQHRAETMSFFAGLRHERLTALRKPVSCWPFWTNTKRSWTS